MANLDIFQIKSTMVGLHLLMEIYLDSVAGLLVTEERKAGFNSLWLSTKEMVTPAYHGSSTDSELHDGKQQVHYFGGTFRSTSVHTYNPTLASQWSLTHSLPSRSTTCRKGCAVTV